MKKILVIEDESLLLEFIEEILKNNGYRVLGAGNGRIGLDILAKEGADLIVCDVIMPVMDGYEVLAEVRKSSTAYIPVILLTGKTERADFRKGMESGADDFIPKPFTEEELIGAIAAQLKKREKISIMSNPETESQFNDVLPFFNKENKAAETVKKLDINDHIFLTIDNQPRLLKVNDLKCVSALGDYTNIFTSEGKFIIRRPMKEWEEMLPEKYFVRIHRSTIINLDFVDKIEKWFNRGYKIYLHNIAKPFIISRRYSNKLREKFS